MWDIKKHGPEVNRSIDHSRTTQPVPFEMDTLEVTGILREDQECLFDAFRRWGDLQMDLDTVLPQLKMQDPSLKVG